MSKYSSFKYGDGTTYGAQTANLRWGLAIAWDGMYGWGDEASRMVSLNVRRGRRNLIAAGSKGLQAFPPGETTVILDNEDGRYDPFNTDSPLYPHVAPGKFAIIRVREQAVGTRRGIMCGVVKDIQPDMQGDKHRVRIVIVDGLQWLADRVIHASRWEDIAKSLVPKYITIAADWPSSEWPKSIATDTDVQAEWWAWNITAYEALREWNEAEVAVAYHTRDGFFSWKPRSYGYFRSVTLDESEILKDIGRPQPWEVVRNIVRVSVHTKKEDIGPYVLWNMEDTPFIGDGETFYIEALFRHEDWVPAGKDLTFAFAVNTQADGGGADITADCERRHSGSLSEGIHIWVTNNSGVHGYITTLRSSGNAVYAPNTDVREASDAASKELYGARTLTINSRWVENSNYAKNLADWLLSEFKDPAIYPIVQIENRSEKQFFPDLYDQIVLTSPKLGITDGLYRIGAIEHQTLEESCQGVRTTFWLEPYMQQEDTDVAFKGSRAYLSTTEQSIPDATWTAIVFNGEDHDTAGFHSTSSNPSRITIPTGFDGYYGISAQVMFDIDAVGIRYIRVRKNGATTLCQGHLDTQSIKPTLKAVSTFLLAAGDYVEVEAYQNSGGALDAEIGSEYTFFGADFLGA